MKLKNLFLAALFYCFNTVIAQAQSTLIDPSFAVGKGADANVYAVLVRADGKIMVGGNFTNVAGQINLHLALLNSNGVPDAAFSADTDGPVFHLAQQKDEKILVSGQFSSLQGVVCHNLGRLLTNGLVDAAFHGGTNFIGDGGIFTFALQPDGKIVAASFGDTVGNGSRFIRLLTNGSPDVTFSRTNVFELNNYYLDTIMVRSNGTIWVGGYFNTVNGFPTPSLAIFQTNGVPNTNFTPVLKGNLNSQVFVLNEMPDGKILIGGLLNKRNASAIHPVYLGRLTSLGQWDASYEAPVFDGGIYTSDFVTSAIIQPDGKIVVGGSFYNANGYWRRTLVRLNPNGQVDPCFDPGLGLLGSDNIWPQTIALQPDGRMVIGGRFIYADTTPVANLTRLLPGNDCDATRVYFVNNPAANVQFIAGICPPGGTNYLQYSTNLVDWGDLQTSTGPYLFYGDGFTQSPFWFDFENAFFRVKKVH